MVSSGGGQLERSSNTMLHDSHRKWCDDLCQRVHTELNRLAGGPESPSLVPEGGGDFYRWSLALCLLTLFVSGP